MIDHERYIGLLAGRELGGLDRPEALELDRHLAGCSHCATEVRPFGDTLAALALAVPARDPGPWLHASIMSAVHDTTPRFTWSHFSVSVRPWRQYLAAGIAAVLVIASVGLSRGVVGLQSTLAQQRSSLATAHDQLVLQGEALAVALDPGHRAAELVAQPAAPRVVAQVVYRPGTTASYLVADGLPANPDGTVYQLWDADAAGAHPLGTFAFDGSGTLIVPFGVDLGDKAATMVTLEPVGGSRGLPGPEVVFGELDRP